MNVIFFTKFLAGCSIEDIGNRCRDAGFDGIDLTIRPDQCVNPDNVGTMLPKAVMIYTNMGLDVPLATLHWDTVDPDQRQVRNIYQACGKAGIRFIKLGYWIWNQQVHYWDMVDSIRLSLDKFEKMGRKHNVCTLVHTHSDNCYGCNSAGVMDLVKGFDPEYISVYLDPAHLAFDGENLPMALDIVQGYLRMVGVKNAGYTCSKGNNRKEWTKTLPFLADGIVDWKETIRLLHETGYNGPLSYHGEIDGYMSKEMIMEAAAIDLKYLREIISNI